MSFISFVEKFGKFVQCVDRWRRKQYNEYVILPLMYRRIKMRKAFYVRKKRNTEDEVGESEGNGRKFISFPNIYAQSLKYVILHEDTNLW